MSRYKRFTVLVTSGEEICHQTMTNSEVTCELTMKEKDLPAIFVQVQSIFLSK